MITFKSVRYAVVTVLIVACPMGPAWSALWGDPAPPLVVERWVRGEPVDTLARGQVYVIEFWATWCKPCIDAIPHLSELQEKYNEDVIFVSISNESATIVESFLKSLDEESGSRIAVDPSMTSETNYTGAFHESGIPIAFIVDGNGNVVWVGDPMGRLEVVLAEVVKGTYDLEAEERLVRAEQYTRQYKKFLTRGKIKDARKMGEVIARDGKRDPRLLSRFARAILTEPDMVHRDLDLAVYVARIAYEESDRVDLVVAEAYLAVLDEMGDTELSLEVREVVFRLSEESPD